MVTTDISQFAAECETWRQNLRNSREDFMQMKEKLRQVIPKVSQKDILRDVEHYENQFHIQLINIHDLKHAIKAQEQKATLEKMENHGQVSDQTWAEHEQLLDEYQRLEHTLQMLKEGFSRFLSELH